MNKNNLSTLVVVAGIVISGVVMGSALAQTLQPQEQKMPGDIQYPISELGNCTSKENCKTFCDNSKNTDVCLKFAEEKNLLSPEELVSAKMFKDTGMIGPGGCNGQAECDVYCGNPDNMEACMTFAIENGMMDKQKLEESQKVLAAIKRGVKLPACKGPKECDKYCSSSEHMEECMNFSIEAGIMDKQKQDESKKVLAAIKRGVKMPACSGPTECDTYCSSPEHMEECMTFSIEAGMMPEQDQERAKKTLTALKQGIKPPACQPNRPDQSGQSSKTQSGQVNQPNQSGQGLQPCDQYCADSSHMEECIKFSVATGNMTEEQAKMAVKTGGKGPGGCVNKEACDVFCNNPDNQEACFQFGKENGMIPEEDLKKMEDGQQKMKDSFSSIPPEVLDCITSTLGADVVEKMKTGSVINRNAGDSINQCFQKFGTQENRPNQNQQGQNGQGQQNQQIQPWANRCKPDANGNPTALACVDGAGKFVVSAKVGSDGEPVCPADSTAKCGNYDQLNQQGQSGDKFQPGPGTVNPGGQQMPQQAGPGGCKGPEECKAYCESHQEECKNFQPQPGQSGQPGNQIAPGTDSTGGGIMQFMKNVKDKIFVPNNQQGQQGQPSGVGGPNEGQGFNPGSGQGGERQGGGANSNPTKCIAECETVGKDCISALVTETKKCASAGEYCRQVTCSNLNGEGNQVPAKQFYECNDTNCTPTETSCFAIVTAKDSACRTDKDVCVMNCQKASKPNQPNQPNQQNQQNQQNQPNQPSKPNQPGQPGGSGQGQGGPAGGPGNNNGGGGQSGWSNGTGNGGGNGGPVPAPGQSGQYIQVQQGQQMPPQGMNIQGQPGQNQPGQFIQGQPGQSMPSKDQINQIINQQIQQQTQGQMIPQGTQPPKEQQIQQPPVMQQPPMQQQPNQPMPPQGDSSGSQPNPPLPPPPSSSIEKLIGSVLDVFRK